MSMHLKEAFNTKLIFIHDIQVLLNLHIMETIVYAIWSMSSKKSFLLYAFFYKMSMGEKFHLSYCHPTPFLLHFIQTKNF